jgi:hypothetical protein
MEQTGVQDFLFVSSPIQQVNIFGTVNVDVNLLFETDTLDPRAKAEEAL